MYKEFKEFIMRGNVVDLAVAVVIGVAFGRIVTSFVEDILMPPIGLLTWAASPARKTRPCRYRSATTQWPVHGRTSSGKNAPMADTGCRRSPRPMARLLTPERHSSAGVSTAPAAAITRLACTVSMTDFPSRRVTRAMTPCSRRCFDAL